MAARSTSPDSAAIRATGAAKAEAYTLGRESLGEGGYVATQMASILGENRVKLVPDIAVGGDGSTRLADVLIGRMLAGSFPGRVGPSTSSRTAPEPDARPPTRKERRTFDQVFAAFELKPARRGPPRR
jgi:hypothetical protein